MSQTEERNTPMEKSIRSFGQIEGLFELDRLSEALRGKIREDDLVLAAEEASKISNFCSGVKISHTFFASCFSSMSFLSSLERLTFLPHFLSL